jgi:hypothetical protein
MAGDFATSVTVGAGPRSPREAHRATGGNGRHSVSNPSPTCSSGLWIGVDDVFRHCQHRVERIHGRQRCAVRLHDRTACLDALLVNEPGKRAHHCIVATRPKPCRVKGRPACPPLRGDRRLFSARGTAPISPPFALAAFAIALHNAVGDVSLDPTAPLTRRGFSCTTRYVISGYTGQNPCLD